MSCLGDLISSEVDLPEPNLLILTFSVVQRQSLISVRSNWHPLAARICSHLGDRLPVMLVGLQRDMRNSGP